DRSGLPLAGADVLWRHRVDGPSERECRQQDDAVKALRCAEAGNDVVAIGSHQREDDGRARVDDDHLYARWNTEPEDRTELGKPGASERQRILAGPSCEIEEAVE